MPWRRSDSKVFKIKFIVYDDFSIVTRKQCVKADVNNEKMADVLAKLQGAFGDIMREQFPTPRLNVMMYDEWQIRNLPVPADKQAVAVENLINIGRMEDYSPECAWSILNTHRESNNQAPFLLPYENIISNDNHYAIFQNITHHTMRECIQSDMNNTKIWMATLLEMVKVQERFPTDYVPCCGSPPKVSNTAEKAKSIRQSVKVPADEQRLAVLKLYKHGMYVYKDYEPQEAITKAKTVESIGPYFSPPDY
jgi:hypothetical protein